MRPFLRIASLTLTVVIGISTVKSYEKLHHNQNYLQGQHMTDAIEDLELAKRCLFYTPYEIFGPVTHREHFPDGHQAREYINDAMQLVPSYRKLLAKIIAEIPDKQIEEYQGKKVDIAAFSKERHEIDTAEIDLALDSEQQMPSYLRQKQELQASGFALVQGAFLTGICAYALRKR